MTLPPLYYASCAGLQAISGWLLDDNADINAHGGEYGSTLNSMRVAYHHTCNHEHHNHEGYGVTPYPSDIQCCYGFHSVVKGSWCCYRFEVLCQLLTLEHVEHDPGQLESTWEAVAMNGTGGGISR